MPLKVAILIVSILLAVSSCVYDMESVSLQKKPEDARLEGAVGDASINKCASCAPGSRCNTKGVCVKGCQIPPTCKDRECGGDGCLGQCGTCKAGEACELFQCEAGCGFSYKMAVSSGGITFKSWTAQTSYCACEATEAFVGNYYVDRLVNGVSEGVVMVLVKWIDSPPEPGTKYMIHGTVFPSVYIEIDGISSELDGKYESRRAGSLVEMTVGDFSHLSGGSFEITFEPTSTLVAASGKRLSMSGKTWGKFR